jgi:cytidyltransferase-like protein
MDGCFDGFHYGHVNALFQAKQKCDCLIVGTHTDIEMETYKKAPMVPYRERSRMLEHCRFVDRFVGEVPYVVRNDILDKYGCSKYLHADETMFTRDNQNAICVDLDRYETYELTRGISSTQLRERMLQRETGLPISQHMDIEYLNTIYQSMRQYIQKTTPAIDPTPCIYIRESFDMFGAKEVDSMVKLRENHPHSFFIAIVCDESDRHIYNKFERAIVLCGISLFDDVWIE